MLSVFEPITSYATTPPCVVNLTLEESTSNAVLPSSANFVKSNCEFASVFRISIYKIKVVRKICGFLIFTENPKIAAWSLTCRSIILAPKQKYCPTNLWNFGFFGKTKNSSMVPNFSWHNSGPEKDFLKIHGTSVETNKINISACH